MRIIAIVCGIVLGGLGGLLHAAEPNASGVEFFEKKIRPVLVEHCYRCHSAEPQKAGKLKAGLRLDNRADMQKGGESGPAVVPGQPAKSLLFKALNHQDGLEMPPGKKLPAAVIADFEEWIRAGAPDPRTDNVAVRDPKSALKHWAFEPLGRPTPPRSANGNAINPIDAFLQSTLRARGISPSAPVERRALVRRLYFDLVGLPPTPEQMAAALGDSSSHWNSKLIEQLLSSPHHGERWGQHWLDVARYADSSGYSIDSPHPTMYHYRDFVIKAINDDLPFDRFVRWQVAGDLITPPSPDSIAATGFCTCGPFNTNQPKEQDRYDELDDILTTTSQAFLGLNLGCARCHDHKYDPVSQREYYRLVAVFNSSRRSDQPLWTKAQVEAAESERQRKIDALALSDEAKALLRRPLDLKNDVQARLHREYAKTLAKVASPTAHALTGSTASGGESVFLRRGNPANKGDKLSSGFLDVLSRHPDKELRWLKEGKGFAHPRLALADWLVDVDHGAGALTARVMVNRLWQHHFGEGLVRTPNDFGVRGEAPTHPELLDWLAGQLIAEGWRLRPLHRLILTSDAYQQSTAHDPAKAKVDPDNRLLWRQRPRRLQAEAVRDAILTVGAGLDRTLFGPAVFPYIPREAALSATRSPWQNTSKDSPDTWRRSIYVFTKRSVQLPILQAFDRPDGNASIGRRHLTTIVPQALHLINDPFIRTQCDRFAERVAAKAGADRAAQVRLAFEIALARPPEPAELEDSLRFLDVAMSQGKGPAGQAFADFCHALVMSNEFLYVE
jgi:hypothetical protein